jgi:multidrug efflux pump subunit AcrA (membrane-fusion protein)
MPPLPKKVIWGGGALACAVLIGGVIMAVMAAGVSRHHVGAASVKADVQDPPSDTDSGPIAVHTIQAKCDPSFSLSVKAPAQVKPYDWADLRAQVAGQVVYIRKAEGSLVKAGELLVQIAVPDLEEEVRQKESIIRQREAELKIAVSNEKAAKAAVAIAAKNVDIKTCEVGVSEALELYRGKLFGRIKALVAEKGATKQIEEESELNYNAAKADTARSKVAVQKAQADLLEANAKLEVAQADIVLKNELIEVAKKDRDRVQALANYAKITAPFDGKITERNVNRGSFVQNATTAHTEPLLRVERQDIVTVFMKVPDEFSSYVSNDTEAIIEMSDFPGRLIHGKVTRFSPSLVSKASDHTLPVQVDLFNGTEEEYQRFLAREKATNYADLKEGALPILPQISGMHTEPHTLLPGKYGEMRLVFRKLANVFLIPSDAVVRKGGTPYIWVVEDGKAKLLQIDVQVDDQKLAKVAIVIHQGRDIVKKDLTGKEVVITSNHSELTEGEPVISIPQDWMPH